MRVLDLYDDENPYDDEERIDEEDILEKIKEKITDLKSRLKELKLELRLEELTLDITVGDKILEEEMKKCGVEDKFGLMSYLLFDNKVLELEKNYKELKIISCQETDKKRVDKLRFEDEVIEELEERFNSLSKLEFNQERKNELMKEDSEYLEDLEEISLDEINFFSKKIKDLELIQTILNSKKIKNLDKIIEKKINKFNNSVGQIYQIKEYGDIEKRIENLN